MVGLIIEIRILIKESQGPSQEVKGINGGKKVICFNCQEIGHTKRFYPKKNKRNVEQEEPKGEVAVVQDGYDSSDMLMVSTSKSHKCWILDSGCSFHMTPNRDWFESFEQLKGGQVILGNKKCCEIEGIGTVD